jgi:hypothetical protein
MQGLAPKTELLFEAISNLNCIRDYVLIGGTALSLQIGKRLSEDLDFCKWSTNLKKDKPTVDWPNIEKELNGVGKIESKDILGFDQVNFVVNGVKISFITKQYNLSPVKKKIHILNNLNAADLSSIGSMKIELILRRSKFRDYYDIYSILRGGISLQQIISEAGKYSNHTLKSRDVLNFISNGSNYKMDKEFSLLNPVYKVDDREIEEFIKEVIQKEYPLTNS